MSAQSYVDGITETVIILGVSPRRERCPFPRPPRPGPSTAGSHGIIHDHRPPADLVVSGRVIQQLHRAIKGITIMNAQILPAGTDRDYAAALDWIKQTAASGTTLSPPEDEGSAKDELVAALLPVITSEHATAIVAQQIREMLSAPRPAPAQELAPADHGTSRYAETVITVSEICTGCGRYYDLSTEADQVTRVAVQQDGTGRALIQCKDIEACYEQRSSLVMDF